MIVSSRYECIVEDLPNWWNVMERGHVSDKFDLCIFNSNKKLEESENWFLYDTSIRWKYFEGLKRIGYNHRYIFYPVIIIRQ